MSCKTGTPSKTVGRLFLLPPPPPPGQSRIISGGPGGGSDPPDPPELLPPWTVTPPNLDEDGLPVVIVSSGILLLDDPTDDDTHYVITGALTLVRFVGARHRIKLSMLVEGPVAPRITSILWDAGASLTDGVFQSLDVSNPAGRALDGMSVLRVAVRGCNFIATEEAIHSESLTDLLFTNCMFQTFGSAACAALNGCRRVQFSQYVFSQDGSTFGDVMVEGTNDDVLFLVNGSITGNGSVFGNTSSTGDFWVSNCHYDHRNTLGTPPFTLEDNVQKVCVFNHVEAESDGATCLVLVRQGVPLPEVIDCTLDGAPADFCQEPSGWAPSWQVLRPLPGTTVTDTPPNMFITDHDGTDTNITFDPAGYTAIAPGSPVPTLTGLSIVGGAMADQTTDAASLLMNTAHSIQRILIDTDISSWQYVMFHSGNTASPQFTTLENATWDDDAHTGATYESLYRGPYTSAYMLFDNMIFRKTAKAAAVGVKPALRVYFSTLASGILIRGTVFQNDGSNGGGILIGGRDGAPFTSTPWVCGEAWLDDFTISHLDEDSISNALTVRRTGALYMRNGIITSNKARPIEFHNNVPYFWENVTVNGVPFNPALHVTFTAPGEF